MKPNFLLTLASLLALLIGLTWRAAAHPAAPQAITYYVSSSSGNDNTNDGRSENKPFRTIEKVNSLNLQPGDKVLFKCGDTWRGNPLIVNHSGSAGAPITFSSYPAGCANQPVLSGAQPINGWAASGTANIYVATVSQATFPYGIAQLFRNGERLTLGRWPNLDAGDGGYAKIESQPGGTQLTDDQLPSATNWGGAVIHIKNMRWSVLNRQVTGSSGNTLSLGTDTSCWEGCTGWGYFLNNHLATLDQDGEWYYDANSHQVYIYSTGGAPDQVEGTVILLGDAEDTHLWGGVLLNELGGEAISYVTVENFAVHAWYRHGIALPVYQPYNESHDLIIRNNTISDVEESGISLINWIGENPNDQDNGWRGGYNITVSGNTILRANHIGIDSYARQSSFTNNILRDLGLVENWGATGMGCPYHEGDASGGICTEDGIGIRLKIWEHDWAQSHHVTVSGNRLERIAFAGIEIFGHDNTLERNVILQPCYVKGDCGGISTYSGTDLASSPVYNLVIRQNIIVDTIGNTDGCRDDFDDLFGFGLYLGDSRDTTIDANTVISSSVHGILLMNASGSVTNNTLYGNGYDRIYDGSQVCLTPSPSAMPVHTGNILFGLQTFARTLTVEDSGSLGTSDNNYFFNPYEADHIYGAGAMHSLASWQAASQKDAHSKAQWYTQPEGQAPRSRILYNDTANAKTFDLGTRQYLDLDQNKVINSVTLAPYTSLILIDNGEAGLQLLSISPAMWSADAAADFTLTLRGTGFTANSVVRWNGSNRPTTFVNNATLTASISAADVSTLAQIPVSVYDPEGKPATQTPARTFYVVAHILQVNLPLVTR